MLPKYDYIKIEFPLRKYIQQLLFDAGSRIWDPIEFWFSYRVELLERCFALNAKENVR
ncbi:MAG: hypothetical protein WCA07_09075 [Gloeobacterales cyanobacterium]